MFVGVYERQLDERGRVALPPSFRASIGESCYLTFGDDGCVRIQSADDFRIEAEEMTEAAKRGEISRAKLRAFSSSVVVGTLDKQGRLVVDARLREHGGIDPQSAVCVIGAIDRIEIWEPSRWEIQETSGKQEIAAEVAGQESGPA